MSVNLVKKALLFPSSTQRDINARDNVTKNEKTKRKDIKLDKSTKSNKSSRKSNVSSLDIVSRNKIKQKSRKTRLLQQKVALKVNRG